MAMTEREITDGEILRALHAIEEGQQVLRALIPAVAVLQNEMASLKPKVEAATYNAAFVAGAITAAAWILSYLLHK